MGVLAGLLAGPALQLQQSQLWPAPWYLALAATGVAGAASLRAGCLPGRSLAHLAVAFAVAVFAFGLCGGRAALQASGSLAPALEGQDLQVTGVVAAMPQQGELGVRLRLAVESAHRAGEPVRVPAVISLSWYGGARPGADGPQLQRRAPALRAGERWAFTVRLRSPHGNLNPHGFDHELWLWDQGIQAIGYVRAGSKDPAPQRLAATWRHPVEQARQQVSESIERRIPDARSAGVVAALVVGDQAAIDRDDWDVFRATGVAHLMSISGLHVTMFAWGAALVIGALWRRSAHLCLALPAQHAALVGGLLLAAGYALFSGWGVPAQRTLWMLAAVAWLRLSGRRWPWPALWLLAGAVVATLDPWALVQPGFWLSFVAVGVLFATDTGTAPLRLGARLLAVLREQSVVTLALAPLTLLLFGQVSLVGLMANLLAIPWVTLVVTPLSLTGVLLPPLWTLAAAAVQVLGAVLEVLAALPGAVWQGAAPPLWAGAAGVLGGLLLAMRLPPALRVLGVPLLLPVLLWQAPRPPAGEFELLAADVGQGTAVVVRTATRTLVYDAGPRYSADSDAGQRVLVPLLRALGERVDLLVLSHRDNDHVGGAAAVLAAHPRAAVRGSIEDGHPLHALRALQPCTAGQRWHWDGVDFEFLHPPAPGGTTRSRPNAASCVLRVANAREAALLPGDIEQAQEAGLVADGAPLRAGVLLVPHHGSKTSSSAAFLDAVQPRLALVQAGYRNRFGHPAPEVVARYAERGVRVVESSRCGAAWWSSARPAELRCEREAAARYWHHRAP